MFKHMEGSTVTLVSKGKFYTAALYTRSGSSRVYARIGNAFIRLGQAGATSCSTYSYEVIDSEFVVSVKFKDPIWRSL